MKPQPFQLGDYVRCIEPPERSTLLLGELYRITALECNPKHYAWYVSVTNREPGLYPERFELDEFMNQVKQATDEESV